MMSPGNIVFWGQKVKGQGREAQKQCQRGLLCSCEFWLCVTKHIGDLINI